MIITKLNIECKRTGEIILLSFSYIIIRIILRTNNTGNAYKLRWTKAKRNDVNIAAHKTPKFFLSEQYINLRKKISSNMGEIKTAKITILIISYDIPNFCSFKTKSCSRYSLNNWLEINETNNSKGQNKINLLILNLVFFWNEKYFCIYLLYSRCTIDS